MSVIFGIHEKHQIVIAGDKRVSTVDGNFISDDWEKVIVINNHLALASAGNGAIEKAIMADICILRGSTAAGAVLNGSSAPQTAGVFQRNSCVNGKGFAGAKAPH